MSQFSGNIGIKLFLSAAKKMLKNTPRLMKLLKEGQIKLDSNSEHLGEVKDRLGKLIAMIRYSVQGKYKVPVRTLVSTISGLIYFVNPVDFIPDFLLGVGFIDDIAVIVFLLNLIRQDLDDFVAWHNQLQPLPTDVVIETTHKLEPQNSDPVE